MKRILLFCTLFVFAVLAVLAQEEEEAAGPVLQISVEGRSCLLTLPAAEEPDPESTPEPEITPEPEVTSEPEITPEPEVTPEPEADELPDYPVLAPGEDCDEVLARLRVPANGVLWIALSAPDEEAWQRFEALEDDANAPRFDGRGRFIGCRHAQQGEQFCHVLWEYEEVIYLIEIPIIVGAAFVGPSTQATPVPAAPAEAPQPGAPQPPPPSGDSPPPPPPPTSPPPPQTTEEP